MPIPEALLEWLNSLICLQKRGGITWRGGGKHFVKKRIVQSQVLFNEGRGSACWVHVECFGIMNHRARMNTA